MAVPSQQPAILAEEFEVHGVRFRVGRFESLDGWAIMEYIRPELVRVKGEGGGIIAHLLSDPALWQWFTKAAAKKIGDVGDVDVPDELIRPVLAFADLVLSLAPEMMEKLRRDLFFVTSYRSGDMDDFLGLLDNENEAFEGMPYSVYYVVIVRAFLVNFSDSFADILSLSPG